MSRTFAGLSGTYNVRANELALKKNAGKQIRCLVYFLDDSQHPFLLDVCLLSIVYINCLHCLLS